MESLCTYVQIQHVSPTEETRLNCLFVAYQPPVCAAQNLKYSANF